MLPQIILLNGVSSSGKTSLAKALQAVMPEPYFHICIDAFEEMMPTGSWEGSGFNYFQFLQSALGAMHATIGFLAAKGDRIIVDHVLIENEEPLDWVPSYLAAVEPFQTLNVKVDCPLEILQQREFARGDRRIGLAEWQSSRIHNSITYDLVVDTSAISPAQCAEAILQFLGR